MLALHKVFTPSPDLQFYGNGARSSHELGSNTDYHCHRYVAYRLGGHGGGGSVAGGLRTAAASINPIGHLRERRRRLGLLPGEIKALRFFNSNDPDLKGAWQRKDLTRIEELLVAGDQLNRTSWARAGESFNEAVATVDLGRDLLARALKRVEPLLARHGIDYRGHKIAPSNLLAGDAKIISLKAHWTQKINYIGGGGQIAGRAAASGNWQVALVAGIASVVMTAINESKYLRQFAEMEGEIKTMAAAMAADVGPLTIMIETRLVPQVDWMIRLIDQIEAEGGALTAASGGSVPEEAARERALRLSFAVAEAKMLLETTAGN